MLLASNFVLNTYVRRGREEWAIERIGRREVDEAKRRENNDVIC